MRRKEMPWHDARGEKGEEEKVGRACFFDSKEPRERAWLFFIPR
jgi:hypothetical protein